MRRFSRRALIVPSAVVGALVISGIAFAGTITQPNTNPFNVPGDGAGNPQPFTVSASGYSPGALVSVEQCDGTPATATGWDPTTNCDLGTAPAQAQADGSGNVTFPANDPNLSFHPFKGESPQSLFNCIAPGESDPGNGLSTFTNCQVRVATNLQTSVADQAFLTITLPTAAPPTSTTSTSTSTTFTSTSSSTSTTSTTMQQSNPSCGMGAGVPNGAKPPKNTGLAKISKGLLPTPAVKDTKWKLTGSVENCVNMPNAPKTGTPIISGSMKLQVELPPGSTCSNLVPGAPVKSSMQVKWNAIDPKNNKLENGVAQDKFKSVATFTRAGSGIPITLDATSPVIPVDPKSKSLFQGKHFALHFVMDETQAQLDASCPGPKNKGVAVLHFTNAIGQSTLTVLG